MSVVLGSWKEIANYLGKGVRTVQRWERQSSLPVHRPSGSTKGVVLAFPNELDRWARHLPEETPISNQLARNAALSVELLKQTTLLKQRTERLVEQFNAVIDTAQQRKNRASRAN